MVPPERGRFQTEDPQGALNRPLLCNVYLHRVDRRGTCVSMGCWSGSLMTPW
jgi:hypothetical protein